MHGLAYGGPTPPAPIPVHAPAGCARGIAGFLGRPDAGFRSGTFDFRPLYDGQVVHYGGLSLTSTAVVHDVEAHGLRAECAGRVLASSGDSGPCPALTGPARAADLFLHEADIDEHRESERVRLTPEDAGDTARRAGARQLLVTHVGPTLTPEAATARAASAFGGPAATAREGSAYVV